MSLIDDSSTTTNSPPECTHETTDEYFALKCPHCHEEYRENQIEVAKIYKTMAIYCDSCSCCYKCGEDSGVCCYWACETIGVLCSDCVQCDHKDD